MWVPIEINEKNIENMLLSAQGWCHYWCCQPHDFAKALFKDVEVEVHSSLVEPQGKRFYRLNRDLLLKGFTLAAEKAPHAFKALLADGYGCDGPTSDVLVQYALFGDVLFG